METGIYILLFKNTETAIPIGSLGTVRFGGGFHAYVGSALGPAGLSRVRRHITLAAEKNKKPRWHVDHLLINPAFCLVRVYCGKTHNQLECQLARGIPLLSIRGFGSSDCHCLAHLFGSPDDPDDQIREAFRRVGVVPLIREIQ
ncbi:MAG TPA: DUF123 domain-containing protein [Methanospirillum sp.]|nr:DUF123 domain-containing protein [Methanospirillum sp.]